MNPNQNIIIVESCHIFVLTVDLTITDRVYYCLSKMKKISKNIFELLLSSMETIGFHYNHNRWYDTGKCWTPIRKLS